MAVFIVRGLMGGDNFIYSNMPHFTDVPANDVYFKWLQKLYELGITAGCNVGKFCPTQPITRDQMAVLIIRARYGAAASFTYPGTPYFTDVPVSNPNFQWIQRLR